MTAAYSVRKPSGVSLQYLLTFILNICGKGISLVWEIFIVVIKAMVPGPHVFSVMIGMHNSL